eukprot:354248-Chlamydomonas_euryale.AAC.2
MKTRYRRSIARSISSCPRSTSKSMQTTRTKSLPRAGNARAVYARTGGRTHGGWVCPSARARRPTPSWQRSRSRTPRRACSSWCTCAVAVCTRYIATFCNLNVSCRKTFLHRRPSFSFLKPTVTLPMYFPSSGAVFFANNAECRWHVADVPLEWCEILVPAQLGRNSVEVGLVISLHRSAAGRSYGPCDQAGTRQSIARGGAILAAPQDFVYIVGVRLCRRTPDDQQIDRGRRVVRQWVSGSSALRVDAAAVDAAHPSNALPALSTFVTFASNPATLTSSDANLDVLVLRRFDAASTAVVAFGTAQPRSAADAAPMRVTLSNASTPGVGGGAARPMLDRRGEAQVSKMKWVATLLPRIDTGSVTRMRRAVSLVLMTAPLTER